MDERLKKLISDIQQINPEFMKIPQFKINEQVEVTWPSEKQTREDYENCSFQASETLEEALFQFHIDLALDTGNKEQFLALTGGRLN